MAAEKVAAQPKGFQRWVPGIPMLRSYRRSWLRFDLVAGVVLAAILVPQGMAYAELAGLPPSPASTRRSPASSAMRLRALEDPGARP